MGSGCSWRLLVVVDLERRARPTLLGHVRERLLADGTPGVLELRESRLAPGAIRDRRLERLPPELARGVAPHRVRVVQVEGQREERRGRAVLADPAVQQRTEAAVEAVERDDRGASADCPGPDSHRTVCRAGMHRAGRSGSPRLSRARPKACCSAPIAVGRGLQVRGPTVTHDGVQTPVTQRAAVAEVIHPERRPVRQLQREHREIDAQLSRLPSHPRAR